MTAIRCTRRAHGSPPRLVGVPLWALIAVLGGALLAGCEEEEALRGECVEDADCVEKLGTGFFCSDSYYPKVCLCANNAACGPGRYCNEAGFCQASVGCYTNADCIEESVCDVHRNRCMPRGRCTYDLHCPMGEVCQELSNQCVPGCRVTGDCPLGQACRCPEGRDECEIGVCEYGVCDDNSFCAYGSICDLDESLGDDVCWYDDRGPYCEHCEAGPGDTPPCGGDWMNRCLVDTRAGGQTNYCGVDCSRGQPCPSGFRCAHIVILTQSMCRSDDGCAPSDIPCESNEDCPGGRCDESGFCAGKCVLHEGHSVGWCTCLQDNDCPSDFCDATTRRCSHTREPCQLDGDGEDCQGRLRCVNLYGRGGCVVGRNCAPQEGISCAEVRSARAR